MCDTKWFHRDGSEAPEPTEVGASGTHGSYLIDHACTRCGGAGGYRGWPGFTCYRCGASTRRDAEGRFLDPSPIRERVYQKAHLDRLNASQQKRDAKKRAEAQAKRNAAEAEGRASFPEAVALLDAIDLDSIGDREWSFMERMAAKWQHDRFITEGIANAVVRAYQQDQERKAQHEAAEDVPEGRIEVAGQILSVKEKHTRFGWQVKMLVLDDRGFKVWGTLPQAIDRAQRGDRVAFTATVEQSADDSKFGFFKRPTNATMMAGEAA